MNLANTNQLVETSTACISALTHGLFDVCVFDQNGTVKSVAGANVLALNTGDNLFNTCPIFTGISLDLRKILDQNGGQIIFSALNLQAETGSVVCDLRLCKGDMASEFVVVLTSTSPSNLVHLDGVRETRLKNYETELYELERQRFENFYIKNPVLSFAINDQNQAIAWSNRLEGFATKHFGGVEEWISEFLRCRSLDSIVGSDIPLLETAIRHDGAIRIIETSTHTVLNAVSGIRETYFVLIDVTEREAALRTVMKQRKLLSTLSDDLTLSNQRLKDFAGMAAHDLVAPLGRISAFAEIIEQESNGSMTETMAFAVEAISKSAHRSRTVVTDILEMAQAEGVEPIFELINLGSFFEEIISDIVGIDRDFDFVLDKNAEVIWADRKLARIIFRNVLGNSIKYRSKERPLKIEVKVFGQYGIGQEIRISDNGMGFQPRSTVSVFDPFVRLQACSDKEEGTGLGLHIVKISCEQLGWVPAIQSVNNVGTTVRFSGVG